MLCKKTKNRFSQESWFFPYKRHLGHGFTLAAALLCLICLSAPMRAYAAPRLQKIDGYDADDGSRIDGGTVVIVIDPGHGGENLGTIENGHEEKSMNMTTALAMYEELLLYDNVEVYLTHTEDVDMSLKERAEFAQSVEADFLFSIHYNASENHEMFGAEVWTSIHPPYNGYGYQFGYEFLQEVRDSKGIFLRGIKARRGDKDPESDYYGIIRHCVEKGIPAVIIEHCHVEEERDAVYCKDQEALEAFGRADAAAAAKYFGLKSSVLNVDYSGYQLAESTDSSCVEATMRDDTAPESCQIELIEADYEKKTLTLQVSAQDQDSVLLYYSYSVDGGKTFSPREKWPESDVLAGSCGAGFSLTIAVQEDTQPDVVFRAYNVFDLYTESNHYVSPQVFAGKKPLEEELEILPVNAEVYNKSLTKGMDLAVFLKAVFAAALVMGIMTCILRLLTRRKR